MAFTGPIAEKEWNTMSGTKNAGGFPWEADWVREDVRRVVSLKIPEPLYLKFEYVTQKYRMSKTEFIRNLMVEEVDRLLSLPQW